MQNGRILTASTAANGTFTVYGQNLGAGVSTVKAEAWYTDNRFAWSVPVSVDISATGTPINGAPVASSYTKIITTAETAARRAAGEIRRLAQQRRIRAEE